MCIKIDKKNPISRALKVILIFKCCKTTGDSRLELARILQKNTGAGHEHSGNARLVRNIIERAVRRQAVRLMKKEHLTREDLILLMREDISELEFKGIS